MWTVSDRVAVALAAAALFFATVSFVMAAIP